MTIGDSSYINQAYSEKGLIVTTFCDVVLKVLVLALIGFAYDCVSYTMLKKVQFMQILMISLTFVVFSIPVFVGLDVNFYQVGFFMALNLLYSPSLFIQWNAPLRLFIGGKRTVVCIIYSVKYLVYAILLLFDTYFAIARLGVIQLILIVIGGVSIYLMEKRIQLDEQ